VEKKLAPIKYSLVQISDLFTLHNFPDINTTQLSNMKNKFINEASKRPNIAVLTATQPNRPLPTVTSKFVDVVEYTMNNFKGGTKVNFDRNGITTFSKVKSVTVCYKKFIRRIQFTVIDSAGNEKDLPHVGYSSDYGDCIEWTVMNDDDEYINTATVYLWYSGEKTKKNCLVRGLLFKTNKGQKKTFGESIKDTVARVCIKMLKQKYRTKMLILFCFFI
jgi:hypothetical protein